jgi:hypothetical protein
MENNNRPPMRQADAPPHEAVIDPSVAQTAALMDAFVQEQRAFNRSLLTHYQSIQQELAAIRQGQRWIVLLSVFLFFWFGGGGFTVMFMDD